MTIEEEFIWSFECPLGSVLWLVYSFRFKIVFSFSQWLPLPCLALHAGRVTAAAQAFSAGRGACPSDIWEYYVSPEHVKCEVPSFICHGRKDIANPLQRGMCFNTPRAPQKGSLLAPVGGRGQGNELCFG